MAFIYQGHDKLIPGKISWFGIVVLTKPARLVRTSTGVIFNAFGVFEHMPKHAPKEKRVPMECFTGISATGALGKMMAEFDKGMVLFVAGDMVKDDYWTERNGKLTTKIEAQFIIPQMDFSGATEQTTQDNSNLPAQSSKEFNCGL